ncbi:polysaccharide deacetylase family protein [Chamaesiphon sp. VAR_48_metabat_135_sub]|uniref:polysaccharide deacetylase family protein n=1 Tax=Chamaesiphon sp. VAR_48_metabat_135_sub TaxID=2964699 RepID=UPI00286D0CB4|nr:polysaccharide deacetylase family protein [Chamaesiphon sp. VAR_48_metabat_135_sub]
MSGVAKLARGEHQNYTKRLLPGKTLWLAIAAVSCAVVAILHAIFSGVPADALIANTGIAKTVDVTSTIASSIPMNFDVPNSFQAKTIKDAPVANAQKVIALTFDDGPWPETTEQILATLKQENIKATFYMIGQPLKSFPEIGKKVLADGHVIANHTLHHWYHKMSPLVAQREIEDTAKIIKDVLNVETAYFRPPGGALTNGLVAYAQQHKYSVNMWSVDTGDSRPTRPTPEAMLKTVLAQATPGGIVLMHDGGGSHSNTAKAVPQIIAKLRAEGYKFVTVPELLELSSAPAESPSAQVSPSTIETENPA